MLGRKKAETEELILQLEDPKKHLFISTPLGPVTISDKITIEDFVRKTVPGGDGSEIKIDKMGGVLNAIYLLTIQRNDEERKIVVKKFEDWLDFKWFPLALWTLGTQTDFAVRGRSRMGREFTVNQFLYNQGFNVPKILFFSPKEQLIFKEFIEGEKLVEIIKRIISSRDGTEKETALIKEAGRRIAEIHAIGVTLGDCKPENIIIKNKDLYFIDFEQAARDGNRAWDVAEFLYYSGHYISPISSADPAKIIAKAFIEGYLQAGGKKETIKGAGSTRYMRVFGLFTPPHVILIISNICKEMSS